MGAGGCGEWVCVAALELSQVLTMLKSQYIQNMHLVVSVCPWVMKKTIECEKLTPWALLKLSGIEIKSSLTTLQFQNMKTLLSHCGN